MNNCIVFDLDDTLYKERDYVYSGFRYLTTKVANGEEKIFHSMCNEFDRGGDAFGKLNALINNPVPKEKLLELYRNHMPDISLPFESKRVLDILKENDIKIGLITDGRSISQRNKINKLGLTNYFVNENIIISEEFGFSKPDIEPYKYFMGRYPDSNFIYIGDNTQKDFIAPKLLGWLSIGLVDNGKNIHKQNLQSNYLPDIWIKSLIDIVDSGFNADNSFFPLYRS